MKIKIDTEETVGSLLKLYEDKELRFNEEYQRAPAWKQLQKQLFIDSVFRGYSIPAFYFHERTKTGRFGGGYYDVIDGQQRIRAIEEFKAGFFRKPDGSMGSEFKLLNPRDKKFKLPVFIGDMETPWENCGFEELDEKMQEEFLNQSIVVYKITTENHNAIRDLFIRLQGGTPLSAQDKRDTYPGDLAKFILEMGGKVPLEKDDIPRYRGNYFFNNLVKGKPKTSRKRQLAAQLLILLMHNYPASKAMSFCDIGATALDNLYREKIGFSKDGDVAKRYEKIVEKIRVIFSTKMPPFEGYETMHLFLLVNSLMGDYADGWEGQLHEVFRQFRKNCKDAKQDKTNDFYMGFARWASQSANTSSTIRKRHQFFLRKILTALEPIQKDKKRIFSGAEKEYIYLRDRGECQWCRRQGDESRTVLWGEGHFHHINPHRKGGNTEPDNGALMHPACHPRGEEDETAFLEWWSNPQQPKTDKEFPPPDGTECRFEYEETQYDGIIENRKLMVENFGPYGSFSGASKGITETQRNGWRDWEIKLPDSERWILADDWRLNRVAT